MGLLSVAEALAMVFSVTLVTLMLARDIWAYISHTAFQKQLEPEQPQITVPTTLHPAAENDDI